MTVKSMKELNDQFNKEDLVWKQKMDYLFQKCEMVVGGINENMTFEESMDRIDTAMAITTRMKELDTKHKKFLLKWRRKFYKGFILNLLFHKD